MGEHNERFSGQVNAHNDDHLQLAILCYALPMGNQWKAELQKAIAASGMSMRAISRAIGASPNAVSEIWTANKEPGVDKVLAIIDAIGASRTAILAGYPMTPETEQLIALLSRMSPAARLSALQFLRDLQDQTNEPGTPSAPAPRAAETSK